LRAEYEIVDWFTLRYYLYGSNNINNKMSWEAARVQCKSLGLDLPVLKWYGDHETLFPLVQA
jgi:hypothetical protein